jgi:hypothetical protein
VCATCIGHGSIAKKHKRIWRLLEVRRIFGKTPVFANKVADGIKRGAAEPLTPFEELAASYTTVEASPRGLGRPLRTYVYQKSWVSKYIICSITEMPTDPFGISTKMNSAVNSRTPKHSCNNGFRVFSEPIVNQTLLKPRFRTFLPKTPLLEGFQNFARWLGRIRLSVPRAIALGSLEKLLALFFSRIRGT